MPRGIGKLTGWATGSSVRALADICEPSKPSFVLPAGTVCTLGGFQRIQDGLECWIVYAPNGMSFGVCSDNIEPCYGPVQKLPFWWRDLPR